MTFLKILLPALFLLLLAGIGYFAITDIPVRQSEKVETIAVEELPQ